MGFGSRLRRSVKRAASSAGAGISREWDDWGKQTVTDAAYGGYAGQLKGLLKYGSQSTGHYSDSEAESLGKGLGVNYQQVEADRGERKVAESTAKAEGRLDLVRQAEDERKRGQVAARIRRGSRSADPRSGTMMTGPGGLGTTGGTAGTFAALLGL